MFGLRKIGKTSLLRELGVRLARRSNVLPILVDLQIAQKASDVIFRIANDVTERFAEAADYGKEKAFSVLSLPTSPGDVDPEVAAGRLGEVLRGLLTGGVLRDTHVVILLDEMELLFEEAGTSNAGRLPLLRALRGVAQETEQLSLVMVGVNATPCETPTLDGRDNPLYGFLTTTYLGPLEPAACREMIRTVGDRMGIRWTVGPMDILIDYVGAHPMLARLVASDVSRLQKSRPFRPSRDDARSVTQDFHRRHSAHFRQIVDSLDRHYPDELAVLQAAAEGDMAFVRDWCDENPEAVNHLVGYGVMSSVDLRIRIPALAEWLSLAARGNR
jgi:hypothetical protein